MGAIWISVFLVDKVCIRHMGLGLLVYDTFSSDSFDFLISTSNLGY